MLYAGERIAMSISGHRTRMIFDRYNIVNEGDMTQGLLKTQRHLEEVGHKIGILKKKG